MFFFGFLVEGGFIQASRRIREGLRWARLQIELVSNPLIDQLVLLPIGLALHRLSWKKVLRSNLTGMKACTSVQNICGDILKPSNFYTKVKPPRLLVSGRKNGAAWFSLLRLVLVVLCTLIVGFQDIHSFDDDVFNVQLVGVSGAPATAPNVWCIEPKSEEAGVGWLVQMVHGRWLLVHFNDCRPQVHQWHVIHILWAPDRWRKWRRKKTKYKCKNKIRCNSPPSRNWPMITWGKKLAGCEIKGRASVCWLQNTKTKTKTKTKTRV